MKEEVRNWLKSADYDLGTAESMLAAGRYVYVVFLCHLSLEKMLKAKIQQESGKTPPKTHNLRYLLDLSGLEADEETAEFISKLSGVSIPARYPQNFDEVLQAYDKDAAERYLTRTKEIFKWIKESLKP